MALAHKSLLLAGSDPLNRRNVPAGASQVHVLTLRLKRLLDADIYNILTKHSDLNLPQWRILSVLSDNKNAMSQKELVSQVVIAQGQASRALYALQTEGLLVASQSQKDRRSWNYSLSQKGRDLFAALLPFIEERREALEGALTHDELVQFERIASKIADVAYERLKQNETSG